MATLRYTPYAIFSDQRTEALMSGNSLFVPHQSESRMVGEEIQETLFDEFTTLITEHLKHAS